MSSSSIRGVIFDLDGTLVDSHLDFDRIRAEMGFEPGVPVLETIDTLPEKDAQRCWEILERHEQAGFQRAKLMPGVREVLVALDQRNILQALVTRNSRRIAEATLERFSLRFDPIVAREDAAPKPDPEAIEKILALWSFKPDQVAIVGDFRFDIEAGHRAGVRTVLFTGGRDTTSLARNLMGPEQADFLLESFEQADKLLAWLEKPI